MGQRRAEKSQSGSHPSGSSSSLVDVGPQGLVQSLKVGPVGDVATPATHHQLEERRGTQWRAVKEYLEGENSHQEVEGRKWMTAFPKKMTIPFFFLLIE